MAQPTVTDVRPVNPVLTDLSIGFKNEAFFWDQIAPVKEVREASGTYFIYTRDFWMRRGAGADGALRAAEGAYTRVGYGVSTDTYTSAEIGFEKLLGEVTRAKSQTPEDLQRTDIEFLTNLIQLELEKRVAAEAFVSGKWGTDRTLSGTDQWSDFSNSDPIADVQTAANAIRRNTGAMTLEGFIGIAAWQKLAEHPLVLDKYKHTQRGVMTPELVAPVLNLSRLVVGAAAENTAAEGQTYVGADIWTDNLLVKAAATPGLKSPLGAATLIWNERGNVPWAVEDYDWRPNRSTVSRVFTHQVPKITSSQHGYLLLDIAA